MPRPRVDDGSKLTPDRRIGPAVCSVFSGHAGGFTSRNDACAVNTLDGETGRGAPKADRASPQARHPWFLDRPGLEGRASQLRRWPPRDLLGVRSSSVAGVTS